MLEFSKTKSKFNGQYEYNIRCDRCGKILGTGHECRNNISTNNLCTLCVFEVFNSEKHQKYKRCMAIAQRCHDRWMETEGMKSGWWRHWNLVWEKLAKKFK